MINAMMGCSGVKQLTIIKNEAGVDVAPEFVGRKLGLVLQKTLKTKDDGRETYNFDIRIPYFAQSQRTLAKLCNQWMRCDSLLMAVYRFCVLTLESQSTVTTKVRCYSSGGHSSSLAACSRLLNAMS